MDVDDLVAQLCTLAGCMMEDTSVAALGQKGDVDQRIAAIQDGRTRYHHPCRGGSYRAPEIDCPERLAQNW